MPYLLDTCAISELSRIKPNPAVKETLLSMPRDELHLSTISVGEIQYGIQLRPDSAEKTRLASWLSMSILAVFGDRILEFDVFDALRWGDLMADLKHRGLTMQLQDSLIAAMALENSLTLVTRNESDFAHSGVRILNPWK
ncbi:MAG TPA: type II toxin-antitoxin system VapC family toxin [Phycisphaerae bacterium]|nr:type II toxin-antitoxin system VapC family toxin [Phycisphaerae bacterium]